MSSAPSSASSSSSSTTLYSTSSSSASSSASSPTTMTTSPSMIHPASLIPASSHSPAIASLLTFLERFTTAGAKGKAASTAALPKELVGHLVDVVIETVDYSMNRSSVYPRSKSSNKSSSILSSHPQPRQRHDTPAYSKFTTFTSLVLSRAEVSLATLLVTIIYVHRARPHLHIALEEWALERVVLGALIVASKYTNDSTLKNVHWALCTSVFGKRDIGRIEREFLDVLDWELGVRDEDVLRLHVQQILVLPEEQPVQQPLVPRRPAPAPPLAPVLPERSHRRSVHAAAAAPAVAPIPIILPSSPSSSSSSSSDSDSDGSQSPQTPYSSLSSSRSNSRSPSLSPSPKRGRTLTGAVPSHHKKRSEDLIAAFPSLPLPLPMPVRTRHSNGGRHSSSASRSRVTKRPLSSSYLQLHHQVGQGQQQQRSAKSSLGLGSLGLGGVGYPIPIRLMDDDGDVEMH